MNHFSIQVVLLRYVMNGISQEHCLRKLKDCTNDQIKEAMNDLELYPGNVIRINKWILGVR